MTKGQAVRMAAMCVLAAVGVAMSAELAGAEGVTCRSQKRVRYQIDARLRQASVASGDEDLRWKEDFLAVAYATKMARLAARMRLAL